MADMRGSAVICNDRCGCPSPCPGGTACRCSAGGGMTTGGGDESTTMEHNKCSCGEHCGCNPCTCSKAVITTASGRAFCKCGDGCTCVSCAS